MIGLAPHSTLHPPTVTISTRPALTRSSSTTVARVACTTGLSRLGCVMITPGSRELAGGVDMVIGKIPLEGRRGRGGTGRHAGLRSRWAKALGGSSPLARIAVMCQDIGDRCLKTSETLDP